MGYPGVRDVCAFVPARDFELSTQFYSDLGFSILNRDEEYRDIEVGSHRFILNDFFLEEHAANYMMFLLVEDADQWWQHVLDSQILDRYEGVRAKPPEIKPWGLKVLMLHDPSGVLWHIAEVPGRGGSNVP